jgi:hypothetical protein
MAGLILRHARRIACVLCHALRLLWEGRLTAWRLRQQFGRDWQRKHFPELEPRRLLRTSARMVTYLWTSLSDPVSSPAVDSGSHPGFGRQSHRVDTETRSGTQARLPSGHRRTRRNLNASRRLQRTAHRLPFTPRKAVPASAATRRILQAFFARTIAALTGLRVPPDRLDRLRCDRSIRELVLTWLELARLTVPRLTPQTLCDSLVLHAMLPLPPGSRLPASLYAELRPLQQQLIQHHASVVHDHDLVRLETRLLLALHETLSVPKALLLSLPHGRPNRRPGTVESH